MINRRRSGVRGTPAKVNANAGLAASDKVNSASVSDGSHESVYLGPFCVPTPCRSPRQQPIDADLTVSFRQDILRLRSFLRRCSISMPFRHPLLKLGRRHAGHFYWDARGAITPPGMILPARCAAPAAARSALAASSSHRSAACKYRWRTLGRSAVAAVSRSASARAL